VLRTKKELGYYPCDCEQPGTEAARHGGRGVRPYLPGVSAAAAAATEAAKDRAAQEVPVLITLPSSRVIPSYISWDCYVLATL